MVLYKWDIYELRAKWLNEPKTSVLCTIRDNKTQRIINGVDIDDLDKIPNGVFFRKRTDNDIDEFIKDSIWSTFSMLYIPLVKKIVKKMLIKIWIYSEHSKNT